MGHFSSMFNGLARSFSLKKRKNSSGNGKYDGRDAVEAMAKEAKRNDLILRSSGTVNVDGSKNFASLFSRRGEKGVNQDCFIVWEEFGCQEDMTFCGIFDGHGPWGHFVSKKVRESIVSSLLCIWQESLAEASADPDLDKKAQRFNIWKESFLKACATVDSSSFFQIIDGCSKKISPAPVGTVNMQRLVVTRAKWVGELRGLSQRCYSQLGLASQKDDDLIINPQMPHFDYSPPPYNGPSADEILSKRKEFLSPSMFYFYEKNPLHLVHGKMQYLFDSNGRRYLDAFGGIATVSCGHCHPDVVEAIVSQTKRLQHSTILYLNNAITDFAEALASKLPGDLKVVFFTNSGTEANELAIMMARLYTGCHDIISLRNAYHGNAAATMSTTGQSVWKFNVVQSGVHHAINPDPYRGVFGSDGEKYAKDVEDLIQFGTSGRVAAFMSEAIQGVGGIVELAPGYLPAAYNAVRKAGGLCIADEVQSGFARTGSQFWGFENQGVVPDIVTMAKGIGNGIPLGAVVTTPQIAEVLCHSNYFNTFGGNPVCTSAGLAVLRVIEKENLQENAHFVGSYLKERLMAIKNKHEIVGDVRGRGLLLGVELVTDRKLKTPAKAETLHIMDQMKDMGVLVGKGGFRGNVFRITPPLCFTKEDADFVADVMDCAMSKI